MAPGTAPLGRWAFGSAVLSFSRGLRKQIPSLQGLPGSGKVLRWGLSTCEHSSSSGAAGTVGCSLYLGLPWEIKTPLCVSGAEVTGECAWFQRDLDHVEKRDFSLLCLTLFLHIMS